jgi:hypothetical protein
MKALREIALRRVPHLALSALAVALAGCGSSHHGGTTTPSTTPIINDLGVATAPQGCTVQGFPGHPRTVTFNFTDTDGNETGGHVDLSLSGGGPVSSLSSPVPSGFVSISGTTSGTITVSLCIAIVGGSATLSVTLTDAAGNQSNTLSAAVAGQRPNVGSSVGAGLSAL